MENREKTKITIKPLKRFYLEDGDVLRQQGEHEGFIGSPPETGIVTFNLENPVVITNLLY